MRLVVDAALTQAKTGPSEAGRDPRKGTIMTIDQDKLGELLGRFVGDLGDAGLADRARFEVASAQTFSGTGYDLVATFDCLHDMGDPVGAARHIRQALDADGTWLIVEPVAGDTLAENLNPVSRTY
jgi:hypothetical protein